MRILVTGADGFIGSQIARALVQAGHEIAPAVYRRAARGREVRVDLAQRAQLLALPTRVEVVVHAAGNVDGRASPQAMVVANLRTTENLLAWAAAQRVRHFVHLSSVAVYGPLALGEQRSEQTPRLGLHLGLPYMRAKALAERAVEQSGVPYTLLRPPVVVGRGDTVLSRGFHDAFRAGALPLLPGAHPGRRVSLALVEGLGELVARLVAKGPLGAPLHAVDVELTFGELAARYARALGRPCEFAPVSWRRAFQARHEVGLAWLIASARFGQHYRRERLVTELGDRPVSGLDSAIASGLSSLQGGTEGLF